MVATGTELVFWCTDISGEKLALVIRASYPTSGVEFMTPNSFGQQVALMRRPKGELIMPHIHLPVNRDLVGTQEVIIMKSGLMRVDLYDSKQIYSSSVLIYPGDVILLNSGGHGFELLEESHFIEVKQGPFVEGADKIRFEPNHGGNFVGI